MDYINKYDELIQILCKIRDKAISALSDTAFSETALVYKREIDDLIKKMLKDKDFNSEKLMLFYMRAKKLSEDKLSPILKDNFLQNEKLTPLRSSLELLESFSTDPDKRTKAPAEKRSGKKAKKKAPETTDDYVEIARELIDKYKWKKSADKALRERLAKIREKQKDKCLNLSVVGEYNTGKSTFINALLRAEVLRSSYIEESGTGTTVVSTVIEYADSPTILVRMTNGQCHRMNYDNDEDLRRDLMKYAATSENGKQISGVTLGYPVEMLKQGMRIIDTPGTGNTEQWHSEVTVRTINEVSDASVILVDPTKALPQSQIYFIKDHLSEVIHQCIFVVTKVDVLRPAEVSKVIEYIKQKISYEFDIDEPFVITYASLNVLDAALGEEPANKKIKGLIDTSYSNESLMYQYILRHKQTAQSNKLSLLLDDIYKGISDNMNDISEGFKKEHDLIEKTKQTDLSSFVEREKKSAVRLFGEQAQGQINTIEDESEKLVRKYTDEIISGLDKCSNKNEINNYIDTDVPNACSEKAGLLHDSVKRKTKKLNGGASLQLGIFDEHFKNEYKRLGLMPLENKDLRITLDGSAAKSITVYTGDTKGSIALASQEGRKDIGKGAVIGGIVGTFLGPGVGTAIGAAIGGFLFAPGIAQVRNAAKDSLADSLNTYFAQVLGAEMRSLRDYSSMLEKYISGEIDRYFENYNSLVNAAIYSDELKQQDIEKKTAELKQDLDNISTYREGLIRLRERLKKL